MGEIDRNARDEQGLSHAMHALYRGERDEAERLLPDELNVYEAAALGRVERLRELLEADAGLARAFSGDGFTALHLAVFFDQPDAASLLLERGAEAHAVATSTAIGPVQPLHSAAAAASTACARLLLDAGADPNARQGGGFTPLHSAAQNGDRELVSLLLAHGADAAATDDDGSTPADRALAQGNAELAALLGAPRRRAPR